MNSNINVYDKIPEQFSPKVEIAAIYVNVNGKILLLQLANNKSEKGFWGVPAGKLEANESPQAAAKRELFEETGIIINPEDHFKSLGMLYMRKPDLDYIYHFFSLSLNTIPAISLSEEHCSYVWVSRDEAEVLALMQGAKDALDAYFKSDLTPS